LPLLHWLLAARKKKPQLLHLLLHQHLLLHRHQHLLLTLLHLLPPHLLLRPLTQLPLPLRPLLQAPPSNSSVN